MTETEENDFESILKAAEGGRGVKIARDLVKRLELDLSGLTVLTECASGPYAFTPVIAALAGAKVLAVGRDSRFGSFAENIQFIESLLEKAGLNGAVSFFDTALPDEKWSEVDIMTNSGFLRPINREKVSRLKSTAVIPLMWETWEWRPEELDLAACQDLKIPVIGSDERYEKASMIEYPGMMAFKLLFSMGVEVVNNHLVLLGGSITGECMAMTFERMNLNFDWFTPTGTERKERCYPYSELRRLLDMKTLDAVMCAEHEDPRELVGNNASLSFEELHECLPELRWGHFSGNVDVDNLNASGMFYYPRNIMPHGYMTFDAGKFGIRLVIELNSLGLKVGEIAAKARQGGKSIEETIALTLEAGVGMDFEGGFLNFQP